MEVEKCSECITLENSLNPMNCISFKSMDSICPMSNSVFDRFVESIGQIFPLDDDDVSHSVKIVSLLVDCFEPLAVFQARLRIVQRE